MIGALDIGHSLDGFRYQEIDIGISLAMTMGTHVNGHAVQPCRKISPMIEVEPPEKHLVRLSRATVLGNNKPRHSLQHIAGTKQRPDLEIDLPDYAL